MFLEDEEFERFDINEDTESAKYFLNRLLTMAVILPLVVAIARLALVRKSQCFLSLVLRKQD